MDAIREAVASNPLFGIVISVGAYAIGTLIYKKTRLALLNPLLLAIILVCGVMVPLNISYNDYNQGGSFITLLLSPATVVLAVPLYDQMNLIKKNAAVILVSISTGALTSMLCIFVLCRAFGLDKALLMSLVPKSVTTAIAIGISSELGGIRVVTVVATLLSGITGAVLGPFLCRLLRIRSRVAVGLAMGTASHAVGTSKAMELGEDEGAMSGLAIGVSGVITVAVAPALIALLIRIWG